MLGKLYSNVMLATLNARSRATASPGVSTFGTNSTANESHQLKLHNPNRSHVLDTSGKVQISTATETTDDFRFKGSIA